MSDALVVLLASRLGPYVVGAACLAAIAAGVLLGAGWDRIAARRREVRARLALLRAAEPQVLDGREYAAGAARLKAAAHYTTNSQGGSR